MIIIKDFDENRDNHYISCVIPCPMFNFILFLVFTTVCGLFTTELSILKTQIEEVEKNIAITTKELTRCHDNKRKILYEIEQVKDLLTNEAGSQNLAEIRRLEDKMDNLLEERSKSIKKNLAYEQTLKAHEDTKKKLEVDLKKVNKNLIKKHGVRLNIPDEGKQSLTSSDHLQNESIQNVEDLSLNQILIKTQFPHEISYIPYLSPQENPFLYDSSSQASKNNNNIYRDKNSLSHSYIKSSRHASRDDSFDKNRTISDSSLCEKRFKTMISDEKPELELHESSLIRNRLNPQFNDKDQFSEIGNDINYEAYAKPQDQNVIESVDSPTTLPNNYKPIPLPRKSKYNSEITPMNLVNDDNYFITASNSSLLNTAGSPICGIDKIFKVNEDLINERKINSFFDFNKSEKNNEIQENYISRKRNSNVFIEQSKGVKISKTDMVLVQDNELDNFNIRKSDDEVQNDINVLDDAKFKSIDENDIKVKNDASLKKTVGNEYFDEPKHVDSTDEYKNLINNAKYEIFDDEKQVKTSKLTIDLKKKVLKTENKSSRRNTLVLREKNEYKNSDESRLVDNPKDSYLTIRNINNKYDGDVESLDMDIKNASNKISQPILSNELKYSKTSEKFNDMKTNTLVKEKLDTVEINEKAFSYTNKPLASSISETMDKDINDKPTKEPSDCTNENIHESTNLKFVFFCMIVTLCVVGLSVITVLIFKKKSYEFIF